jgi:uncharacterized protein GlcG (DUF336 family)
MSRIVVAALAGLFVASGAFAQLADKKVLTLAEARRVAAAAEAEATRSNLKVVIAIVDDGGHLVLLEKLDDTQIGSIDVAIAKGRTAALFRRETKVFEDSVAGGRNVVLKIDAIMPIEGGVPLLAGGRAIGAIGVSGGTPPQDGVVAKAGAVVLK